MTIEKINNAFNESLEEISLDDQEAYSMEFVQHHEKVLEDKLSKLKKINGLQYGIFLIIFLFIIFNDNGRFVNIPYNYSKFLPVIL
jgi:L-rhamnose mutarotase